MTRAMLKNISLGVAFFVELGALAALCYWGFTVGQTALVKVALGLGAPALAAVVWAFFGAPKSRMRLRGAAYLVLQAMVFGAGALALIVAGQPSVGIAYALVALVNSAALAFWKH